MELNLKKINELQQKHYNLIGERLKELRIMEGLSIPKLTKECQLPQASVYNIEKAKGGSAITLIIIVNYFITKGYNLKWIFYLDNSNESKKTEHFVYAGYNQLEMIDLVEKIQDNSEILASKLKNSF